MRGKYYLYNTHTSQFPDNKFVRDDIWPTMNGATLIKKQAYARRSIEENAINGFASLILSEKTRHVGQTPSSQ